MNNKSYIYQSLKYASHFLSLLGHAMTITEGLFAVTHYVGWFIHHTGLLAF